MFRAVSRYAAFAAGSCAVAALYDHAASTKPRTGDRWRLLRAAEEAGEMGACCEADADDAAGYEARIRAAVSHATLFDRLASERDSRGFPVSLSRNDFLRARLFCHMLPTGSLSSIPDSTSVIMSKTTRDVLGAIGDPDNGGRVSWSEYLVLSALLNMSDSELQLVLAASDGDGSGNLSQSELDRALSFALHEEISRAVPNGTLNALQWRPVRRTDPDKTLVHAKSSYDSENGVIPGTLEIRSPESIRNASRTAKEHFCPHKVAQFVQKLRDAVVELEFVVFADAGGIVSNTQRAASTPVESGGALIGMDLTVWGLASSTETTSADMKMSPAALASYLVCQSASKPDEMASLLAAWELVTASSSDSLSSSDLPSASRAMQPRSRRSRGGRGWSHDASLSLQQFRAARYALVDRSDNVIAALRLLTSASSSGTKVTAAALRAAVGAVSGEVFPLAAARCVLLVLATRHVMNNRSGFLGGALGGSSSSTDAVAEAERDAILVAAETLVEDDGVALANVAQLLASHAGSRVGVKKQAPTLRDAFNACLNAD